MNVKKHFFYLQNHTKTSTFFVASLFHDHPILKINNRPNLWSINNTINVLHKVGKIFIQ